MKVTTGCSHHDVWGRLRWAEPDPTWVDYRDARAEGAWHLWDAARLRTPHVRADHLPRVARGVAAAVAQLDPARELIVVGVSNGAVCASALAEETAADAAPRDTANPNHRTFKFQVLYFVPVLRE